jgi:hypothetical protein
MSDESSYQMNKTNKLKIEVNHYFEDHYEEDLELAQIAREMNKIEDQNKSRSE